MKVNKAKVVTSDGRVWFVRVVKPNTTNDAGAIRKGQWWSPYSS